MWYGIGPPTVRGALTQAGSSQTVVSPAALCVECSLETGTRKLRQKSVCLQKLQTFSGPSSRVLWPRNDSKVF